MKYRNLMTGNVIDINSSFTGKDWQPLGAVSTVSDEKAKVAPVQRKNIGKKPVKTAEDKED